MPRRRVSRCDGVGRITRQRYRFKHFRCVVSINHAGDLEVADMYLHALARGRVAYTLR
jgi:hypothetical protein